MEEVLYRLWLAEVLGPANEKAGPLLELYGSARAVFEAREREDFSTLLQPAARRRLLEMHPRDFTLRARYCLNHGIRIIGWEEETYPLAFTRIPDPPAVLYCTGDPTVLNGRPFLGMVGSRRPSQYGAKACEVLGRRLAREGCVLVSGLADGLDSEAHRAALRENAATVGILGTPIDHTYPAGNEALRAAMEKNGCVISEYPPLREQTGRHCFLQRNRLVAALSDVLCVVEARVHSGTFNTVEHAHRYGTPVYAVPGSIFSTLSEGTNRLLREGGAQMAACPEDLLLALGMQADPQKPERLSKTVLGKDAKALLRLLGPEKMSLEQLCVRSGLNAGQALAALTELELAGKVTPLPGRQYLAN